MRAHPELIGLLMVVGACLPLRAQPVSPSDSPCDVTVPNGIVAGASARKAWSYGNGLLSVGPFGLWPDGTVVFKPDGAGFTTADGALGMKFGWTRGVRGTLTVSGRRLDGVAAPLRFETNDGYGDIGFQASYLIFPTPGCWEVTAQVGEREDSRMAFTTKVVKLGEGPAQRRDSASR
jgi:hypothetical protein